MVELTPKARAKLMKEQGPGGLQDCVEGICRALRLDYYHTYSSKKSQPGYPDMTIVAPLADGRKRIIFVELKNQKRRPTEDQARWLDHFSELAMELDDGSVESLLWRPMDWFSGEIDRVLRGGDPQSGLWLSKFGVYGDKLSQPR